jgi:hypothetical protein
MELAVVEFPHGVPGERLAPELARLVDSGVIRIVDLTFVTKSADGTVSTFELSERDGEDDFEALDGILHAVEGLISEDDLAEIAAEVNAGATAAVLLFEHVWARDLREIMTSVGGEVAWTERIPAAVVEAVAAAA